VVYLVHFARPYRHARHYLGYTADVGARAARHAAGHGARLLEVVTQAGIPWQVVRVWENGDRALERRLKAHKKSWRLCPVCRTERGWPPPADTGAAPNGRENAWR
jgi:predicted GIY-YIG superfamily endonuclease